VTVRSVGLIGLIAAGMSGVPRYAASLLRALDQVADEYADLHLRLVTTAAGAEAVRPSALDVRLVGGSIGSPRSGGRRVLSEQVAAATERSDVLHFFDLTGPVLTPWRRFVSTVHDASQPRAYKRVVQPWAARHATALVAVSAHARDEAVRAFHADRARIAVIHSGPGLEATAPRDETAGPDAPYLLYVGDLTEHKNLPFLADGALLLPLGSQRPWVDAVRRIAADSTLRGDFQGRARKVLERYSWERTARAVCDLFLNLNG